MIGLLTVGRLARLTQVSPDTIRYYERIGLLPASRSPAGHRRYSPAAVQRLQLIRGAQTLGLTLTEIGELLNADVTGFGLTLEQELLQRLPAQLAEAEQRVAWLRALQDELASRHTGDVGLGDEHTRYGAPPAGRPTAGRNDT